jgi:hypothetical protein
VGAGGGGVAGARLPKAMTTLMCAGLLHILHSSKPLR